MDKVISARKRSPPLSVPDFNPSRTARSISRCEVTPTFFKNLRTSRLNVSSLKLASAIRYLFVCRRGLRIDRRSRRAAHQRYAKHGADADRRLDDDFAAVALHQAVTNR